MKGSRAKEWKLVDQIVRTQEFGEYVKKRAAALAEQSDRPADGKAVPLVALQRAVDANAIAYRHVSVAIDRAKLTQIGLSYDTVPSSLNTEPPFFTAPVKSL